MSSSIGRSALSLALLCGLAAPALAEETLHELRVTSLSAFSVAQAITSNAVCGNPNACLQNEVRLPVRIDFDAGTIVIDGRSPTDENGNPVPPGGPGGMLFNTQSGPVEMRFAPPCENPDGCVGGEAVYFGTIDQGGRIAFPSLGLDFELFGVSPISKFRAPMGTGESTDPADPSVVAEGSPLDFATGAVTLAGIDFVPAPIIGTSLQLNRIRGTIVPVPVPPVALTDVLRCQKAIEKQGAVYVKKSQAALTRCVDALVACAVREEADGAAGAACTAAAAPLCDAAVATIDTAGDKLTRGIRNGCRSIGAANMLALEGGLGFSLDKPLCELLGQSTSTRDGIAACMERRMQCSVEEALVRAAPRAAEVLAASGHDAFVAPLGCMPALSPGDATGGDSAALLRCQSAIEKQINKYGALKQKKLQSCVTRALDCHLHAEEAEQQNGGMHVHDPLCVARAQKTCEATVRTIAAAGQKRTLAMQSACAGLEPAGVPALLLGLGFSNLAQHCQELSPPVGLGSVDEVVACLDASLECSIESTVRILKPRAAESFHVIGLSVGGIPLNDRYPCLEEACGDGILDVGEQCDPLLDPTEACNPDCTRVVCGNGVVEPNEDCDDGNTASGDGCSATCTDEPFACGNGIVETFAGEVCDDNDSAAGDGCNADCKSNETCGNGVVDTIRGETCDDGGLSYVVTLDGAHETPPVVTAATGSATLTLNGDDTLTYSVTTTGLSATMAHIHQGATGVPGPILINLVGGPTTWAGTTAPLTTEQRALLKAGNLYINVHTVANAGGEIRGQINFAPTASGDGCSANCRSNETCGNGVIDAVTGEVCDDGNTTPGDGCDGTCALEMCSFVSSGSPLGTRAFSIEAAGSGLFNSILGLGSKVGQINVTSGPMSLTAGATDATGSAPVTLDADVIVQIDITAGNTVQCLKFDAAGSSGSLNCCGGHAVGMSNTRDSNTGGLPTTGGQSNGPAISLAGIGTGGIGDMLVAFSVRQAGGGSGFDCLTATYGPPSTQFWTTGSAAGRVVRPAQGGALIQFTTTGQPFQCSAWTSENGPGTLVSADTALNAIPGIDANNLRKLDD